MLMEQSNSEEKTWRLTDLNTRISCLRQLLASISNDKINDELILARQQLINIQKKLSEPLVMPGPTGESNIVYLENRGNILCYTDESTVFDFFLQSVITVLATGNTLIVVVPDSFYEDASKIRDKFISTGADEGVFQLARGVYFEDLLNHPELSGVLVDVDCSVKNYITDKLSQRYGAILPVISSHHSDNLVQRLLTEKTISIDTTASGGNTSLMTMTEE